MSGRRANRKLFRARSRLLGSQNSREFGNIVPGAFTPVLAKHTESFNLIDTLSVGVDRIQRNFDAMNGQDSRSKQERSHHLELHPTKTRIVYCKDRKRKGKYPNVKFDFLGYCFRPRQVQHRRDKTLFCGFNPGVSPAAMKAMRTTIRELNFRHQTQLSLDDIAQQLNPFLRGWIQYYGRYAPSALYPLLRYVNQTLVAWVMRKFKRWKGRKTRASQFLQRLARERADLFVHWHLGMTGTFN